LRWKPAGKLTAEDGTSKFVDSHLWANLHDEVRPGLLCHQSCSPHLTHPPSSRR
jgi:hypothetical protein